MVLRVCVCQHILDVLHNVLTLIALFAANSNMWAMQCTLTRGGTSFFSNAATPPLDPRLTEAPSEPKPTRLDFQSAISALSNDLSMQFKIPCAFAF